MSSIELQPKTDQDYSTDQNYPVPVLDHLAGMHFWWDAAPSPLKRQIYCGRVVASLEGGYYLLRFADSAELPAGLQLPAGLHEIAHVATMTEQAWSFYRDAEELANARAVKDDDGAA